MRLIIQPDYGKLSKWTAAYIARKIIDFKPGKGRPFVLGLPTGSSPIGAYAELARLHKQGKVSFRHVVTFNMDEYVGIAKDHPQSYRSFMHRQLFDHIDIPAGQINILDGNAKDLEKECEGYEARIEEAGGIHLFLGGVGPDGEPWGPGGVKGGTEEGRRQLRLRGRHACMLADSFFEAGFTVVVDDVVIGSRLAEFRSDLRNRPLLFVMLAPRADVVRQRDAQRAEKQVFDTWGHLDEAMRRETPNAGLWLDSSAMTAEETVDEIVHRSTEAAIA